MATVRELEGGHYHRGATHRALRIIVTWLDGSVLFFLALVCVRVCAFVRTRFRGASSDAASAAVSTMSSLLASPPLLVDAAVGGDSAAMAATAASATCPAAALRIKRARALLDMNPPGGT